MRATRKLDAPHAFTNIRNGAKVKETRKLDHHKVEKCCVGFVSRGPCESRKGNRLDCIKGVSRKVSRSLLLLSPLQLPFLMA